MSSLDAVQFALASLQCHAAGCPGSQHRHGRQQPWHQAYPSLRSSSRASCSLLPVKHPRMWLPGLAPMYSVRMLHVSSRAYILTPAGHRMSSVVFICPCQVWPKASQSRKMAKPIQYHTSGYGFPRCSQAESCCLSHQTCSEPKPSLQPLRTVAVVLVTIPKHVILQPNGFGLPGPTEMSRSSRRATKRPVGLRKALTRADAHNPS